MDIDVIKSYLVGLGFAVNQPELSKFEAGIKKAGSAVEASTSGVVKSLLKWQTEATAAFVAVSSAVIALADHVAMADQEYRLFGLRMFLTTENARKLKMGMDALGASMEQIAWDPETRKRFLELSDLQDSLTGSLGPDFEDNMRKIRDVRFEFTKLKIEMEYLSFKVVESLFNKMGTSVEGVKAKLEEWVAYIRDHMPQIADFFATNLKPVLEDTWEVLKSLGHALEATVMLFTNLIGLLSGDDSIQGTEFNFHKLAGAVQHVVDWLSTMVETLAHAEEMLVHFASAAVLTLSGRFDDARKELETALDQLTPGTGGVIGGATGAAVGMPIGGMVGTTVGGALGTMILPGIGTAIGGALGGTIGTGIGALAGGSAGGMFGSVTGEINQGLRSQTEAGGSIGAGFSGSTDMASRARALAIQVGRELGVNPNLIFEQWQHETGAFTNPGSRYRNNLGGIRKPGSLEYRTFDSLEDYGKFYTGLMRNKRYTSQGILQAKNEEEWAGALKRGGYYEGPYDEYAAGMKRFGRQNGDISMNQPSGGTQQVTVDVGGIHITEPGANAEQIQQATTRGITSALAKQTQRNLAQLPYAG